MTGAEGHPGVRRSPAPAVVLSQGGALRWEIGPDPRSKMPFCVVITRAAVRISRSSTSTCDGDVTGNQAAAACSRACACTRSAHYRSHHAPYSVSFRWLGFHDGSYGIQYPSPKIIKEFNVIQDSLLNLTMGSDGIIDPILHFYERSSGIIGLVVGSITCLVGSTRVLEGHRQLTSLRTMVYNYI